MTRFCREKGATLLAIAFNNIRELKQTTTATATKTSPNKKFNAQNNGCTCAF